MQTSRSNEEWKAIILECRASELSDKEWCAKRRISRSTFYYHLRKLREQEGLVPERPIVEARGVKQEIVPLRIENGNSTVQDAFKEMGYGPCPDSDIRIECHGMTVTIPSDARESSIRSVIMALGGLCQATCRV